VSTQPTVKLLHGRDERGFAIGSAAAAQAARLYAAEEKRQREPDPEMPPEARLRARLLENGRPTPKRKTLARKAAEELGVPIPEWAKRTRKKYGADEIAAVIRSEWFR
jgi:hypothetical protein